MQEIQQSYIIAVGVGTLTIILLAVFFIILIVRYQRRLLQKQVELFNAVIEVQERERERIARDLHDQVGPMLSISKIQVETLDSPDDSLKQDILAQLGHVITDIRNTSHDLMPSSFIESGLVRALQQLVDKLKLTGTQIDLVIENYPEGLNRNAELNMYRILQELFNNTSKYAQASTIKVGIKQEKDGILITYEDNGKGFQQSSSSKGIGLKNIESRIKLLNGDYWLQTAPNEGVKYQLFFTRQKLV